MTPEPHITPQHYEGIGRVAVAWASVEMLFMFCIGGMLNISDDLATVTFWHMGYNDKRDRLINLVELADELTEEEKKEFDCLITRTNAAASLRNIIAHSVWAKSDKPNAITPHVVRARGGKIKRSGINLPEQHFTPERLVEEADKIRRLGEDMLMFGRHHLKYDSGAPEAWKRGE